MNLTDKELQFLFEDNTKQNNATLSDDELVSLFEDTALPKPAGQQFLDKTWNALNRASGIAVESLTGMPGSTARPQGYVNPNISIPLTRDETGRPTTDSQLIDKGSEFAGSTIAGLAEYMMASQILGAGVTQLGIANPSLAGKVASLPGQAGLGFAGNVTAKNIYDQVIKNEDKTAGDYLRGAASGFVGGNVGAGIQNAMRGLPVNIPENIYPFVESALSGAGTGAGMYGTETALNSEKGFDPIDLSQNMLTMALYRTLPMLNKNSRQQVLAARQEILNSRHGNKQGEEALKSFGLKPGASKEELTKRYRNLSKDAHPDRGGAEEHFKAVNQAYNDAVNYIDSSSMSQNIKNTVKNTLSRIYNDTLNRLRRPETGIIEVRQPNTRQPINTQRFAPIASTQQPDIEPEDISSNIEGTLEKGKPHLPKTAEGDRVIPLSGETPSEGVIALPGETAQIQSETDVIDTEKYGKLKVIKDDPAESTIVVENELGTQFRIGRNKLEEMNRIDQDKLEVWRMPRSEYIKTVKTRVDLIPEKSFEEFVEEKGYKKDDLPTAKNYADFIGGALTETTTSGKGKLKQPIRKIALSDKLYEEYKEEISEGKIKQKEVSRPIEDTKADEAYKRMQHKRIVKKALDEGKIVPEEVLKDYPDLQNQKVTEIINDKSKQPINANNKPAESDKDISIGSEITYTPKYEGKLTPDPITGVITDIQSANGGRNRLVLSTDKGTIRVWDYKGDIKIEKAADAKTINEPVQETKSTSEEVIFKNKLFADKSKEFEKLYDKARDIGFEIDLSKYDRPTVNDDIDTIGRKYIKAIDQLKSDIDNYESGELSAELGEKAENRIYELENKEKPGKQDELEYGLAKIKTGDIKTDELIDNIRVISSKTRNQYGDRSLRYDLVRQIIEKSGEATPTIEVKYDNGVLKLKNDPEVLSYVMYELGTEDTTRPLKGDTITIVDPVINKNDLADDNYYINVDNEFIPVLGAKPFGIGETKGLDLFRYKPNKQPKSSDSYKDDNRWTITEARTGAVLEHGKTIQEAAKNIKKRLEKTPITEIIKLINRLEKNNLSPRYKDNVAPLEYISGSIEEKPARLTPAQREAKAELGKLKNIDTRQKEAIKAYTKVRNGNNLEPIQLTAEERNNIEPISRKEIIEFVFNELELPISQGRQTLRGAQGEYHGREETIRVSRESDLNVIAHEIGHHLHKTLHLHPEHYQETLKIFNDSNLDKKAYKGEARYGEGNSEFVKMYLKAPKQAHQIAPKYYNYFVKKLNTNKDLLEKINTLQEYYIRWDNQPAEERVRGSIARGEYNYKDLLSAKEKVLNAIVDDLIPITKITDLAKNKLGIDKLPILKDPDALIRAVRASENPTIQAMIYDRALDPNLDPAGKSLKDILDPVMDYLGTRERIGDFETWALALHALEREAEGKPSGIKIKDLEETVKKLEKPGFRQASKGLKQFQNILIDWHIAKGRISEEAGQNIKDKYEWYLPLKRLFSPTDYVGNASKRVVDLPTPVKRAYGSHRIIIDPLQSIIQDTIDAVTEGYRNEIGVAIYDLAQKAGGMGNIIETLPKPKEVTTFTLKQIEDDLRKAGVPDDVIENIDLKQIAKIYESRHYANLNDKKENIHTIRKNGEVIFIQVHDETLNRALKNYNQRYLSEGIIQKIFSAPASIMKAGSVLAPRFWIKNPYVDQFTGMMFSKETFIPILETFKGAINKSSNLDEVDWKVSGGSRGSLTEYMLKFKNDDEISIKEILEETGSWNIIKNVIDGLGHASGFLEDATRKGHFYELGEGINFEEMTPIERRAKKVEIAAKAREGINLDYQTKGWLTNEIDRYGMFFAPGVNEVNRIAREFRYNPLKFTLKGLALFTIPSILNYLRNRDDKSYQELPTWRKIAGLNIKVGDRFIYLPVAFGTQIIFGSVPVAILEYLDRKDPEFLKDAMKESFRFGLPTPEISALNPLIDIWQNQNNFTGAPIVPESQQYLKPSEQYGEYTSAISKFLGKQFNLSPRKIDSLIRGFGSSVGADVMTWSNLLSGNSTWKETISSILPFYIEAHGQESVNRIYDIRDRNREIVETYETQREKKVPLSYSRKEYAEAKRNLTIVNSTASRLNTLRKRKDSILKSKRYSENQKKKKIKQLDEQMTDIARNALKKIR